MENRTERRATVAELRAEGGDGGPMTLAGHASVFDQWTTLYDGRYYRWREVIRPGAFTRALRENQDVVALLNHDPNFVLGRTASGTLSLREDDRGLYQETKLADSQMVRDMVWTPVRRGDINGMSFGFRVRQGDKAVVTDGPDRTQTIERAGERVTLRYEGEKLIEEREVTDADLFDVSAVTFPAYPGTDVGLRSFLGIEERVKEMDRPHKAPAPKREAFRRWLEGRDVAPSVAGTGLGR